jgi:hypothetical protein
MNWLEALRPKTVGIDVVINAYGVEAPRTHRVELLTLSYHRWHEIRRMVSDPPIPLTKMVGTTKSPNPDDPDYKRAVAIAELKRNALCLAAAIEGGGTGIDGGDLEAKAIWLAENVDAGVMTACITFLRRSVESGFARVVERADDFRPVPSAGDADVPAQRLDAGDVDGAGG